MTVADTESERVSEKGERRTGIERREFLFTAFVPERRSGKDRRRRKDRRQKPRRFIRFKKAAANENDTP